MNKIPTEILSIIFEAYTASDQSIEHSGLGGSPRILALVNRRWYYTAIRTPSLWRTILITDSAYKSWQPQHFVQSHRGGGRGGPIGATEHSAIQICTSQSQLARTLQRAAASALDLTFCLKKSGQALCSQFYETVFNETVGPHISNLVFKEIGSWTMEGLHSKYPLAVGYSFVRLVRLEVIVHLALFVPDPADRPFLQIILEHAPNLAEIALSRNMQTPNCLRLNAWRGSSYRSTIENLKRLTITNCEEATKIYGTEVHVRELVLHDATLFETRDHSGIWTSRASPWPWPSSPQTTFTYLTSLHLVLTEISYISRLLLPLLESLRITQSYLSRQWKSNWAPSAVPHFTTGFPKLRSLQVTSICITPLIYFYTPHLESLHLTSRLIDGNKAEADFMGLFEGNMHAASLQPSTFTACLKNVIKLHLSADVSDRCIVQALRLLPSLRELIIVPGRWLGLMLVKALTRVDNATITGVDASMLLCPELCVIHLNLCEFARWNEWGGEHRMGTATLAELPAALEKLVKSRKQGGGQALEIFTVIGKDGEKQEYV